MFGTVEHLKEKKHNKQETTQNFDPKAVVSKEGIEACKYVEIIRQMQSFPHSDSTSLTEMKDPFVK